MCRQLRGRRPARGVGRGCLQRLARRRVAAAAARGPSPGLWQLGAMRWRLPRPRACALRLGLRIVTGTRSDAALWGGYDPTPSPTSQGAAAGTIVFPGFS